MTGSRPIQMTGRIHAIIAAEVMPCIMKVDALVLINYIEKTNLYVTSLYYVYRFRWSICNDL